jgi:uncharacterized protein (TIGR00252 family)
MSTERGRAAEGLAAAYLAQQGHAILDLNWRNRWCELDLVTRSPQGIHIVEVKYRRQTNYGAAAEYITQDKANRLRRGALAWVQAHHYDDSYQIDVLCLEGDLAKPTIEYLPNVIGD